MAPSWPSAVVAVAIIALVGLMFWLAVENDFATIWAGVGTIVGVVTGAIPSYFFQQQARKVQEEAEKAHERAEVISGFAAPEALQAARAAAPEAFR